MCSNIEYQWLLYMIQKDWEFRSSLVFIMCSFVYNIYWFSIPAASGHIGFRGFRGEVDFENWLEQLNLVRRPWKYGSRHQMCGSIIFSFEIMSYLLIFGNGCQRPYWISRWRAFQTLILTASFDC